ncbi:hypothetical protein KW805_03510 [Candidatus Pacearchaeota archaeon]|nr:hypothetical protein [Candidatus Pacearchaeota archaeon]
MSDNYITIHAGLGGENSDVFQYISSPIPKHVTSIDEKPYSSIVRSALKTAGDIARETKKNVTLNIRLD